MTLHMPKKRDWVPQERFGIYQFGVPVKMVRSNIQKLESESDEYWDAYKEPDSDDIRIYVEDGKITCVGAYERFDFKGKNLIGLPFEAVLKVLGIPYDHSEIQDVLEEKQTIYRFDALSLVVWVKGDRVDAIQCGERVDD